MQEHIRGSALPFEHRIREDRRTYGLTHTNCSIDGNHARMRSMNIGPRTRQGYITYIPMYGWISYQPSHMHGHDMYVRYHTYRRAAGTTCVRKLLRCIDMYACHVCEYTCMHVLVLSSFLGMDRIREAQTHAQGHAAR